MRWRPVDVVVVVVAVAMSAGMVMSAYSVSILGTEISETRGDILKIAVGGMISAISMYIGAEVQRRKHEKDD